MLYIFSFFFEFFSAHLVSFLFFVFFFGDGKVVLRLLPDEAMVVRAEMHLAVAHLHLLNLREVLLLRLLDKATHCCSTAGGNIRLALKVLHGRRDVILLDNSL